MNQCPVLDIPSLFIESSDCGGEDAYAYACSFAKQRKSRFTLSSPVKSGDLFFFEKIT